MPRGSTGERGRRQGGADERTRNWGSLAPMSAAWARSAVGFPGARVWLALVVWGGISGCSASLMTPDDGRLRHRELGYRIDLPGDPESASWERVDVEGADVAWALQEGAAAAHGGTQISLSSSCRKTAAKAAVLARQLALGTQQGEQFASEPVALGATEGWSHTFEAVEEGVALRVKTVTLMSGGCVYDWVLVTPASDAFVRTEPVFDAWWRSFEPPRAPAPEPEAVARDEGTA